MEGRYQAYSEYKDSGVEWLGDIPRHWYLTKIKYVTTCLDGYRIPLNALERSFMQGKIPYWGANQVVDYVNGYLFDEELILLGEDGAPFFDSCKDVAFNVFGKIWPNNHVHVLRPKLDLIDSRFLKYAINCSDFHLYISGSTRDKLNQSDMNEIFIRICDALEQTQIANFLDHETAKIDTLIEKQQQLIALLMEKRQAVISHAVTKGLNPDVPMKHSGVEWLGEVPAHWEVKRVKHYGRVIGGYAFKSTDFVDTGVISIKIANVSHLSFDWTDTSYLPEAFLEEHNDYVPPNGSLIFAMTRPIISGGVKVAKLDYNNRYLINQRVGFLKPSHLINQDFLMYVAQSKAFYCEFENNLTATNQPNISSEGIETIHFTCPNIEEQNEIVSNIKSTLKQLGLITKKAEQQINLLQERRTALISAAVTGKIDVRNWQTTTLQTSPETP